MSLASFTSKRIVVDASILRGAASSDGGPPEGVRCRRALRTILEVCHRAVVSRALQAEYDSHASRFGGRWMAAMTRRGKVALTRAGETGRARGWKQSPALSPTEREELAKDLHLVMAALETDKLILSADDTARRLFARVGAPRELGWARVGDPGVDAWLRDGAEAAEVPLPGADTMPRRRSHGR